MEPENPLRPSATSLACGGGETSQREPGDGKHRWQSTDRLYNLIKPSARQLRREQTSAEKVLWAHLRKRQAAGAKFRRQQIIGQYVVDFYCHAAHLIIEVDGEIHNFSGEADAVRQEFLEAQGYTLLRFTNDKVLNEIDTVILKITQILNLPPSSCAGKGTGDGVTKEVL